MRSSESDDLGSISAAPMHRPLAIVRFCPWQRPWSKRILSAYVGDGGTNSASCPAGPTVSSSAFRPGIDE